MNIDWSPIQAVIASWVRYVCGLPEEQVLWSDQDQPQGKRPYVSMKFFGGLSSNYNDSTLYEQDLDAEPGEELTAKAFGQRQFTVQIDVITDSVKPGEHALAFASALESSLNLSDVLEPMTAVDLAVVTTNEIQNLTELEGGKRQSRAVLEVVFNTKSLMTSRRPSGYIDSAEITGTVKDGAVGDVTFTKTYP